MNPGDAAVGVGLEWGYDTGACRGSKGDGGSQIAFVIHMLLLIALVVGPTRLVLSSRSRRWPVLWWLLALFIGMSGLGAIYMAPPSSWIPGWVTLVALLYVALGLPFFLIFSLYHKVPKDWSTFWSKRGFSSCMPLGETDVNAVMEDFPGIHNYFRYRYLFKVEHCVTKVLGLLIIPPRLFRALLTPFRFVSSFRMPPPLVSVVEREEAGDTVRVLFFMKQASIPIASWVIMAWFDSGSEGISGMDEERGSFNLLKRTLLARMSRTGKGCRFNNRGLTRRFIAQSKELKVDEIEALLERPGVAEGMGKLIRHGSVTLDYYKAGRSDGLRCVMSLHPALLVQMVNIRFDESHIDTMLDIFPRIRER